MQLSLTWSEKCVGLGHNLKKIENQLFRGFFFTFIYFFFSFYFRPRFDSKITKFKKKSYFVVMLLGRFLIKHHIYHRSSSFITGYRYHHYHIFITGYRYRHYLTRSESLYEVRTAVLTRCLERYAGQEISKVVLEVKLTFHGQLISREIRSISLYFLFIFFLGLWYHSTLI